MREVRDSAGAGIQEFRIASTQSDAPDYARSALNIKNGRLAQTIPEDGEKRCSTVSVLVVPEEDE